MQQRGRAEPTHRSVTVNFAPGESMEFCVQRAEEGVRDDAIVGRPVGQLGSQIHQNIYLIRTVSRPECSSLGESQTSVKRRQVPYGTEK